MSERDRRATRGDPALGLVLVLVLACLLPFLGKPVQIDDPLFLRAARQLDQTPLDPFAYSMAWSGVLQPAHQHINHPPLQAWLIWFGTKLFGFREMGLHALITAVVLAGTAGTYACARRLCRRPGIATLSATLTPVFLVSSTTLMADALFAATFTGSIVCWLRGLEAIGGDRPRVAQRAFAAAAVVATACAMTRYNGIALVPLLALHLLLVRSAVWRSLAWLVLPVAVFAGYQWLAFVQHGQFPLHTAALYSAFSNDGVSPLFDGMIGVVFAGGCVSSALLLAPRLWSARGLALLVVAAVAVVVAFPFGLGEALAAPRTEPAFTLTAVQVGLWFAGGLGIGGLVVTDLWRRRDPPSLLLALWIAGTFVFTCVVNWTVNARSLLPLAAPVGILIARRLDDGVTGVAPAVRRPLLAAGLAASALLSLAVAAADAGLARASRDAALVALARAREIGAPLHFRGHWGWQWVLEEGGAVAIDAFDGHVPAGAIVAQPDWEAHEPWLAGLPADRLEDVVHRRPPLLATMDRRLGAGFYANATYGPLPFAFGTVEAGRITLERLRHGIAFGLGRSGIERRPWNAPDAVAPR